jgi:hypothetical protein
MEPSFETCRRDLAETLAMPLLVNEWITLAIDIKLAKQYILGLSHHLNLENLGHVVVVIIP